MSKSLPELSKAEWLIMNCCWKKGKRTARQVYEEAREQKDWEYQTVKTMLDRLTAKGYLKCEKLGPLCLFEAAVQRAPAVARAIDAFLDTTLGDTLAPLFSHLAKSRKLSDEEIAALKKMIDQKDR
jgi:BlaI family transcriptional regulator, penicillinase repressor